MNSFNCLSVAVRRYLRKLPLFLRKQKLARLCSSSGRTGFRRTVQQGEIGPDLFKAACSLEGIESKRADRPYRAGRPKDWVKIKNRKHPAYRRYRISTKEARPCTIARARRLRAAQTRAIAMTPAAMRTPGAALGTGADAQAQMPVLPDHQTHYAQRRAMLLQQSNSGDAAVISKSVSGGRQVA